MWTSGRKRNWEVYQSGCWQEMDGPPVPSHQAMEGSLTEAPFTERKQGEGEVVHPMPKDSDEPSPPFG